MTVNHLLSFLRAPDTQARLPTDSLPGARRSQCAPGSLSYKATPSVFNLFCLTPKALLFP